MRFFKNVLLLILGICIGGLSFFYLRDHWLLKNHPHTDSDTLLKQMRKVAKLVTVEGDFSTILDHKDYYAYDWIPFRKKALLKVRAKVMAGYDLQKLELKMDNDTKTIYISNFPEAEILSIEPDIKFFDLQEGWFNTFNEEDLSKLNDMAGDIVALKAYNSELMKEAESKAIEILDIIRFLAESSGWTVVIEEGRFNPQSG